MDSFDLTRFLPYQLAVLSQHVSGELATIYGEHFGIDVPEWRVLAHINHAGTVSVRDIHNVVNMEKSKVSRAASRLEARGLLSKQTNPDDRRLVALALTPAGHNLMAQILPLALEFENGLIEKLGRERSKEFQLAIQTILKD
jgi:DNA-binding MarR family transcriptional regulator